MNKIITVALAFLSVTTVFAQTEQEPEASASAKKYHEFRNKMTVPSFADSKIKGLVKNLKWSKDEKKGISRSKFNALTFQEQVAYCLLVGEQMRQNCDLMPALLDEEHHVYGYFPDPFNADSAVWSEFQEGFMKAHRAKVVRLLKETLQKSSHVGPNIKGAIIQENAVELIPDIVQLFKSDRKDNDLLTVLFLLMKEGKYEPFLKSQTFEKLYGDNSNYKAFVESNSENQDLTIQRAMDFYQTTAK